MGVGIAVRGMKLKLCRNVHDISLYNHVYIAVAHVLSFLWQLKVSTDLIMGKVKIGIYCFFIADILTKVFQKFLFTGPLPNILF